MADKIGHSEKPTTYADDVALAAVNAIEAKLKDDGHTAYVAVVVAKVTPTPAGDDGRDSTVLTAGPGERDAKAMFRVMLEAAQVVGDGAGIALVNLNEIMKEL